MSSTTRGLIVILLLYCAINPVYSVAGTMGKISSAGFQKSKALRSYEPGSGIHATITSRKMAADNSTTLVKEIQSYLNVLGYRAGPVDGIVGSRTVSAIIEFETDYSLDKTASPSVRLRDALSKELSKAVPKVVDGSYQPSEGATQLSVPNEKRVIQLKGCPSQSILTTVYPFDKQIESDFARETLKDIVKSEISVIFVSEATLERHVASIRLSSLSSLQRHQGRIDRESWNDLKNYFIQTATKRNGIESARNNAIEFENYDRESIRALEAKLDVHIQGGMIEEKISLDVREHDDRVDLLFLAPYVVDGEDYYTLEARSIIYLPKSKCIGFILIELPISKWSLRDFQQIITNTTLNDQ